MLIRELQKHFPARLPEWWNAATMFAWGAYTLMHPGIFDQPYLQGLVALGGDSTAVAERFWGLVTITVGLVRGCALFVNGSWTRTPLIRLLASAASAFVWGQIVIGILQTGVYAHGLVMYSSALLLDMVSAYRAGCDVATAELIRREAVSGTVKRGKLDLPAHAAHN